MDARGAPLLLLFAKPAVPGRVKTRLIPALGAVRAARLHAALVARSLEVSRASSWGRVELCVAAPRSHGLFRALAREGPVPCRVQSRGDLGRRMDSALRGALRRAPYVVLIGSDCPTLEAADLEAARRALERGRDAVLGPARDGGYWLIGVRAPAGFLFRAMPWGTARVLDLTRRRLRRRGWRWCELEPKDDLDKPADLRRLRRSGGASAARLGRATREVFGRATLAI